MPSTPNLDYVLEAHHVIDSSIACLKQWTATLSFEGILGFTGPVELFQYTESVHAPSKGQTVPTIIFYPALYPPKEEGLHILRTKLSLCALMEGTALNNRCSPTTLTCFRCSVYKL
jgi:hypothetical protein